MKTCSTCIHKEICNLCHYGTEAPLCKHYREENGELYIITVLGRYQWFTIPKIFTTIYKAQEYIRKLPDGPYQVSEIFFYSKHKKYTIKNYPIEV